MVRHQRALIQVPLPGPHSHQETSGWKKQLLGFVGNPFMGPGLLTLQFLHRPPAGGPAGCKWQDGRAPTKCAGNTHWMQYEFKTSQKQPNPEGAQDVLAQQEPQRPVTCLPAVPSHCVTRPESHRQPSPHPSCPLVQALNTPPPSLAALRLGWALPSSTLFFGSCSSSCSALPTPLSGSQPTTPRNKHIPPWGGSTESPALPGGACAQGVGVCDCSCRELTTVQVGP